MIRIPPTSARGESLMTPIMPPPQMQLRSRRETNTKDAINNVLVEQWQTGSAYGIYNRKDQNAQAVFNDQMPNTARTDQRSFLQAQPYVATADQLSGNPYFQKYDVQSDPRNVSRELRGAVYETPEDRGQMESKRMLERQFTAAYIPPEVTQQILETNIMARDKLMPAMDDMTKIYPKTINSWSYCKGGSSGAAATNQK
jgi:hypothetical protein